MLEIHDLSVSLSGREVLCGVDAAVGRGEWLGVVGANGAGKTTLLRAVVGLVAYRGSVTVGGEARQGRDHRSAARLVAYVPQRPVLPSAMTITDYVLLGRTPHQSWLGGEGANDREVAADAIDRLDLGDLAARTLGEVSGGEAQRAVLARALATEAPVLAMDEPTASLDLGHSQRFLELAAALCDERGLCVICALHDLNLALQYADEVLVLQGGRPVAKGAAAGVLTAANVERYFGASVAVSDGPGGPVIAATRPARARG